MKTYYDTRAPEYDDWYLGQGLFAGRERPGWEEELAALVQSIATLPPLRTLDVACGTGFLTRHLRGAVTAFDQSARMLAIARERVPEATIVQGDALELPFGDLTFDRVFTAHFYGHLEPEARTRFLEEARRVASELIVVDAAIRPDHDPEEWQDRVLNDGAQFTVYKRFFDPARLLDELGGGSVIHAGSWFVMVSSP